MPRRENFQRSRLRDAPRDHSAFIYDEGIFSLQKFKRNRIVIRNEFNVKLKYATVCQSDWVNPCGAYDLCAARWHLHMLVRYRTSCPILDLCQILYAADVAGFMRDDELEKVVGPVDPFRYIWMPLARGYRSLWDLVRDLGALENLKPFPATLLRIFTAKPP